ncbi:restriction endonuclease subunit S [Candidatus Gracilibacteria bacterium]|nr:restriction endonuclease subunit S [Candidatus Gracilibacteria bacterium]
MQLVKIGDLLARRKDPIFIQDGKRYKRVTIRINHNGVCLRNEEIGEKIGTKRQFLTRAGDFILSRIDARHAAFGVVPEELEGAIITNDFWTFEINKELMDLEYFYIFSQSEAFLEACKKASKGTTNRKRIDEDFFVNYEFRLPDKKMQHEIVERYKCAKVLHDKLHEEHGKQQYLITKLKQSILMDAISGNLVPQSPSDESPTILVEKINDEKEQLINEGKIRKQIDKMHSSIEKPFAIPESWTWVNLMQICTQITDGAHHTPTYIDKGVPFLSVKDMSGGIIELSSARRISRSEHEALCKRCNPEFENILFSKVGTTGIAKIIDTTEPFSIFVSLALLKFNKNFVFPLFLENLLNSPYVKQLSGAGTEGIGNKNLVLRKIKQFVIPLPPFNEQKRIAQKISHLNSFCSSLNLERRTQLEYSENLEKLLLRELFQVTAV